MKKTKKQIISEENRKEIFYHLINSFLAGGLVFLGSLTAGKITLLGVCMAFSASLIVALTKFKSYWEGEEQEYCKSFINFIP